MEKNHLYLIVFIHFIIYGYLSLCMHSILEIPSINGLITVNNLFLFTSLSLLITIYMLNIKIVMRDIFLKSILILLFLSFSLFIIKLYFQIFFYNIGSIIDKIFFISLGSIYIIMFYGFLIYEPLHKIDAKYKFNR